VRNMLSITCTRVTGMSPRLLKTAPFTKVRAMAIPPPDVVRSLEFYYNDGNAVFRCVFSPLPPERRPNDVTRISRSQMFYTDSISRFSHQDSNYLAECSSWRVVRPAGEGTDDSHPIQVENGVLPVEDFEALLRTYMT